MAKFRSSATALAKSLERSSTIVYIVGDDLAIQFANPACARWLGADVEQLFDVRAIYCSEPTEDGLANRLRGLCPPPEIFDESTDRDIHTRNFVISNHRYGDQQRWRRATAFRLTDLDEGDFSVLVVSSGEDLETIPTSSADDASAHQLHQALLEIRRQSRLSHRVESLVGSSPFAARIRRQSRIAAASSADVLIVGPAGSGKEHLARTIHACGHHDDNCDLVPVHCSVADQELIQTVVDELWGTRKSWQDADASRDAGALLLLDVDQLNPAAQVELWGFLQSPKFSLRMIATSTQSLMELAAVDRFQVELAHAISTMTIELVPLAKRAEDIPLLTQSILERQNPNRKRQLAGFDKSAMQLLTEYLWPGNLDQLSELIRQAATEAKTSLLVPADLPKKFHDSLSAQRIGQPAETMVHLDSYLESVERELITRAIQQSKGNKTKAAKLLSINRAKLLRRLNYFQLEIEIGVEAEETDVIEPSAFEEIK